MNAHPARRLSRAVLLLAALAALPALAQDHPFARYATPGAQLLNGRWNGVDLERRTGCTNAPNNGDHGTYAQFDVATDEVGDFNIFQTGITGLNCTYLGHSSVANGTLGVQGTYSCTDGKQGSFRTRRIDANGQLLTIRADMQLTGTESCTIDSLLSLARFYP